MTRVLSTLLNAAEPNFRLSLRQLELSAGNPSTDIRLTTEIQQVMKAKLRQLGLDPEDTTGRELYASLGQRLSVDEKRLARALKAGSGKDDTVTEHIARKLQKEIGPQSCFVLKNSVAKRLFKASLPKRTLKALGYRSMDSMLKHEPIACLYAAAWLSESDQWSKKFIANYVKLKATDFEVRPLTIESPVAARWQILSDTAVAVKKHNVLTFKELGSVVLLPLPKKAPHLSTLATLTLAIHAVNDISAGSTYMKLHQVQPDFGTFVRQTVIGEPILPATFIDTPVSWSVIQRFYARFKESVRADIFEPLVQAEDMAWHSAEHILARIEPSLEFWQGTAYAAMLDGDKSVSGNLTDAILSHCNHMPFESRLSHYFRRDLLTELSLRYMVPARLEQSFVGHLQRRLAIELIETN